MRLGIMQPYFFPYIGYFSLIKHVDEFILFDTAQFIRHGWIERNRILKPGGGWQYFCVPLIKHHQKTSIIDIRINNEIDWKGKIIAQIQHYKKAPYYNSVFNILERVFADEYDNITLLNKRSLEEVCKYLNIKTKISVFSKMDMDIGSVNAPDEWALKICQNIEGANEYWNPSGGIEFFDVSKYKKNNIDIAFLKVKLCEYNQRNEKFESGLSIVDVMMYNSAYEINKMLDTYELKV